jgi:tyrosinase
MAKRSRSTQSASSSSADSSPGSQTRFNRVQAILADAAGHEPGNYGEAGRFWELPRNDFIKAKIYGVPLIARESETSCCGGDGARSSLSGLVRALRGDPPFNGSRFPPLMWNGKRVGESDIAFIADWIDDGCPVDDRLTGVSIEPSEPAVFEMRVIGDVAEFTVANGARGRRGYREGELRQRSNLDCMGEPEIARLREGFRCLFDLNEHPEDRRSYNNQALIHQNHCQHGWERFLPWHRAYLYEFEQNLQDFFPDLTLPYWDWTAPGYWNCGEPQKGWIIPAAMKAYLTTDEANKLVRRLDPKPTSAQQAGFAALAEGRRLFASQREFFAHVVGDIGYGHVTPDAQDQNRQAMIDALLQSNALWYPLRYPAEYHKKDGSPGTINEVIHYHFPSPEDMAQIAGIGTFRDFGGGPAYNAAFGFLDQNPHNTMHIWTGGMNPDLGAKSYPSAAGGSAVASSVPAEIGASRNRMVQVAGRSFHTRNDMYQQYPMGDMFSNLTASYDPIFWPIHVNIDRIWHEWQARNPNSLPADLDSVLSPWSYTIRDTLNPERFGYEYVRGTFFMPVGMEAPVARFVSKPIAFSDSLKRFQRAEIRLHWVPQLERSCFIRAFLNEPGADASTSIQNNPHYAGYLAIFGHGACYGGPGHCDLPPPRARDFDHRPRNHNMPRNHRIDVTVCAKALLEQSAALQLTLVVIGADYCDEPDLLRVEGVSLNLLD